MLELLKLSFYLKFNILKCKWFGEQTDEFEIAKFFELKLNKIKNKDISGLIIESEQIREKYGDNMNIKNLSNIVIKFLKHIESDKMIQKEIA